MKQLICFGLLTVLAAPAAAAGQSLAEIARKEDARRKAITEPGKVYTNADLRSDAPGTTPAPPASPAPEGSVPAAPGAQVPEVNLPGGQAEPEAPEKTQAYWSDRITSARAALERSRIFADALQSRINALTADFVNRDDPAQRAQIELERQRTTAELERVKQEIAEGTRAIAEIEEEARKAGVPPGWLR